MTQQEVSLSSSFKIKANLLTHWDRNFTVTRSANLNASPKMRRKEAYLLPHMEILISVTGTNLINNCQKVSLFSVV
jgi:hypothetical protein